MPWSQWLYRGFHLIVSLCFSDNRKAEFLVEPSCRVDFEDAKSDRDVFLSRFL